MAEEVKEFQRHARWERAGSIGCTCEEFRFLLKFTFRRINGGISKRARSILIQRWQLIWQQQRFYGLWTLWKTSLYLRGIQENDLSVHEIPHSRPLRWRWWSSSISMKRATRNSRPSWYARSPRAEFSKPLSTPGKSHVGPRKLYMQYPWRANSCATWTLLWGFWRLLVIIGQ